ncbi:MAG: class C sortase [Oscillospiraceae bacterium]|nr:class C sortase [Oscillospiraceae bacterium]MBQ2861207.1 class C sortase [Oscillospiraceae bacterium]MBQ3236916.1 class C sortase [Oscillospiraceae bacterium]MBQ4117935.1 class C sortase [Oscillospiraceae bacterium]MBQ6699316.1 class C sortase [Oscillospiraceae bacterium]
MKKKNSFSTIILIVMLVIGLSLLLYPSFSDYWNSFTQSKAITSYAEQVANLDSEEYDHIWSDAYEYNVSISDRRNIFLLSDEQRKEYNSLLNLGGDGIMGYIDIPSIDVLLPIYHGTTEAVLSVAVGHLDWSSLPVGGTSTHCVVSGHRGLPSAKLFTDIDKLAVGDYFMMNILDEVLTYEVDQIRIVLPEETDDLLIEEGKDLCTLVTCTPYGINSHRLLVRGHRVDNIENAQTVRVTADAVIVERLVVVPFVLAPILVIMLVWLLFSTGKRKR